MFFGATSFSAAPFASEYSQKATVLVNGKQINIAIGDTTINIVEVVPVTGNGFKLATTTGDVIIWNTIPPNANQIWIPIDPDNP